MDTLTHALSGALLARASASRAATGALELPRRVGLGTLAAAFPDADFVQSFGSPVAYMLTHRGLTHSLVLLPLWALLLAWIAMRVFRDPRGLRPYLAVSAMGIGIHIAGDLITSYGTMIYAPLSDVRIAFHTTFIIDLYFSGIIVAGLAFSGVWRKSPLPAIAACAMLVAYVGMQALLRNEAIAIGAEYQRAQRLEHTQVIALPRALSPFNWTIVVAGENEQHYANVNLLREAMPPAAGPDAGLIARITSAFPPAHLARWIPAPRFGATAEDARIAREAWSQPSFAFYRWFASVPSLHRIDRGNPSSCVWFEDLRFAMQGRTAVPFRYGMCMEAGGRWQPFRLLEDGSRESV
jgi:inner membrane protein